MEQCNVFPGTANDLLYSSLCLCYPSGHEEFFAFIADHARLFCLFVCVSSTATFRSLLHHHFGCNGNRGFPADNVLVENDWQLLKYMVKIYKAKFPKNYTQPASRWLDLWENRQELRCRNLGEMVPSEG